MDDTPNALQGWVAQGDERDRVAEFHRQVVRDAAVAGWTKAHLLLEGLDRLDPSGTYVHTFEEHVGGPMHHIDPRVQQAVEAALYGTLGDSVTIVVEEVVRSMSVPPGGYLAIVDPVDGTAPATHLGFGWSVVVLLLVRLADERGWSVAACAIVDDVGHVCTYAAGRPRYVFSGNARQDADADIRLGDVVHLADGRLSLAAVMASPEKASAYARLGAALARTELPDGYDPRHLALFNLGGTPTAWGLLRGGLAVSATLEESTPWDAAHALICSQGGAQICTLDGSAVTPSAVMAWFAEYEPEASEAKTIPPHVVGKNSVVCDLVVEALSSSIDEDARG